MSLPIISAQQRLAERVSSLPSRVALSEQIGSFAAGSARRSVSVVRPVFS